MKIVCLFLLKLRLSLLRHRLRKLSSALYGLAGSAEAMALHGPVAFSGASAPSGFSSSGPWFADQIGDRSIEIAFLDGKAKPVANACSECGDGLDVWHVGEGEACGHLWGCARCGIGVACCAADLADVGRAQRAYVARVK